MFTNDYVFIFLYKYASDQVMSIKLFMKNNSSADIKPYIYYTLMTYYITGFDWWVCYNCFCIETALLTSQVIRKYSIDENKK